jgi:FixJ family two-component response regulator
MVTMLEGSSRSSTEGGPISIDDLAGRDRKILDELGSGRTPEEVATRLGISIGDVERRQDALQSMLGADSLPDLRQITLRTGWREWQTPRPPNSPTSAP